MAIFRLQENMPDVYPRKSRDFQLLCNTFDAMLNAVKFDIDSITYTADTQLCSDRLLPLLQSKLGFFSKESFTVRELRAVLQVFKYVVRNKGSRIGIQAAIAVFLKLANASSKSRITIIDDYTDSYGYKTDTVPSNTYVVEVAIEGEQVDTTLLTELLKYVLPAGYQLKYSFYSALEPVSVIHSQDVINIAFVNIGDGRGIRATTANNAANRYPYELTFTKNVDNEPGGVSYFYVKVGNNYELLESMPHGWPNGEYYKRINGSDVYTAFTVVSEIIPAYEPGVYYDTSETLIEDEQQPEGWGERSDSFFKIDYYTGGLIPVNFCVDSYIVDADNKKDFKDAGYSKSDGTYVYYSKDAYSDTYTAITDSLSNYETVYLHSQLDSRYERVYLTYNSIHGVSTTSTHPAQDANGNTYQYSAETGYDIDNPFYHFDRNNPENVIQPIDLNKEETLDE